MLEGLRPEKQLSDAKRVLKLEKVDESTTRNAIIELERKAYLPERLPSQEEFIPFQTTKDMFALPHQAERGVHEIGHHTRTEILAVLAARKIQELIAEGIPAERTVALDSRYRDFTLQLLKENMKRNDGKLVINENALKLALQVHDTQRTGDWEIDQMPHSIAGEKYLSEVLGPEYIQKHGSSAKSIETVATASRLVYNHGVSNALDMRDPTIEDLILRDVDRLDLARGPIKKYQVIVPRFWRIGVLTQMLFTKLHFQASANLLPTAVDLAKESLKDTRKYKEDQFRTSLNAATNKGLVKN